MLQWMLQRIVGTKNQRELRRIRTTVDRINVLENSLTRLSEEALQARTQEFKERLNQGESLDELLPEAFAVVKNACRRLTEKKHTVIVRGHPLVWDMVPFDEQLIGGMVLHSGKIAEMATGEGKTLVATLPVYLNALTGKGVHVVTVNDYLAARDAEWMGELYRYLGLTVGCLQNGQMPSERRAQYACDITYGTASEFGFDYLRDNGMATSIDELVQRGHVYALIDEVDSILIDEARTPLIISGPATVSTHQYDVYKPIVGNIVKKQHALLSELANQAKAIIEGRNGSSNGTGAAHKTLTPKQYEEVGRMLFKVKLGMPHNKVLLKLQEESEIRGAIEDAELKLYLDTRKTELYKLKEELYFSIDEKNSEADLSEMGRKFISPSDPEGFVMPDMATVYHEIEQNDALTPDQKIEAKQKAQRAYEEASQRIHNISQLLRAYCLFEKDKHYVIEDNKVVIVDESTGRPMYGRRWSDGLHQAVEAKEGVRIDQETQTLATITIQNYFRLYQKLAGMTGTAETEANELKDIYKLDVIVIPTHRPCVRQDLNDRIFKTRREKLNAVVTEIKKKHENGQPLLVGTASVEASEVLSRMLKREGITHHVLNAKHHQQEAEIVVRAGLPSAVTIATNMAGRGTDIKLGAGVVELGGLHVIGTERHESRRIDRQLRGRCARQGDPGSSAFYISFEDDLMRNFADSRTMARAVSWMGMKENESLEHPMMNKCVEKAQKRVEERNYQIRKRTLEYDDVMNRQRNVIYAYRLDILTTQTIRQEIFTVVDDLIDEKCQSYLSGNLEGEGPDRDGLLHWANTLFPLGLERSEFAGQSHDASSKEGAKDTDKKQIAAKIKARVRQAYELKVQQEDPSQVESLERSIVLGAIDKLWQEHLYAMDGLRTSIALRAYGQKDPLIEYQKEAFDMFEALMQNIKEEIAHTLFRSSSSILAFEKFLRALPQTLVRGRVYETLAMPNEEAMAGSNGADGGHDEVEEEKARYTLPIQRTGPKLGRNDPCPLDLNKKFKNCCGANGLNYCANAAKRSSTNE